ncbi:MAG: archease [Candidatus Aminicenantes bacterium]|nr:archease [Candidatus Aminicenantes bacterium]
MPYKIGSHTADLRIIVTGENIEKLFVSALAGMMSYLGPRILEKPRHIRRMIKIESLDKTALLVDFLNEVLSLSQINKESYDKIIFKKLAETKIEAEIFGNKVENFRQDIKAATYHEADIKKNEKGELETVLVFDI